MYRCVCVYIYERRGELDFATGKLDVRVRTRYTRERKSVVAAAAERKVFESCSVAAAEDCSLFDK